MFTYNIASQDESKRYNDHLTKFYNIISACTSLPPQLHSRKANACLLPHRVPQLPSTFFLPGHLYLHHRTAKLYLPGSRVSNAWGRSHLHQALPRSISTEAPALTVDHAEKPWPYLWVQDLGCRRSEHLLSSSAAHVFPGTCTVTASIGKVGLLSNFSTDELNRKLLEEAKLFFIQSYQKMKFSSFE